MFRFGVVLALLSLAQFDLSDAQCYVQCSPGWGNNVQRDIVTTTEARAETRPPSAAGCGVNMYMNSGESATIAANLYQQNTRGMEFPWMAFVVYEYGTYLTLRSAAIINSMWLVTVANDPVISDMRLTAITAYFAHYRVLGNISDNAGQFFMKIPITNYFADPENALALLKLPTPLGFSNWNVQSICLPATMSTCSSQCMVSSRAVQSGWSIFFPDLNNVLQKATTEIPSNRFLNTTFQLGSVISTVQFGRYTLCGFTGFDNTFLSVCASIDWINARQRAVPTVPISSRPTGMPKCGINGYNAAAAHTPMSLSVGGPPRSTNVVQTTLVNEFPWQVALHVYCSTHPDGSVCAICSGVVINQGWVLTTRTCFSGITGNQITNQLLGDMLTDVTQVVVRFGAYEIPRIGGVNRTSWWQAKNEFNATVPPNAIFYDPTRTFAMLKLPAGIINFGNWTVQPVCIPQESDCADTCEAGTDVVMSGWSYGGGQMQKVTFQIPTISGYIDQKFTPMFSFGSPIAVQTYTPGTMVPQNSPVAGQVYYPGQWSAVTLCGMVDGHTGRYASVCGSYCWMANPEAQNVPQKC